MSLIAKHETKQKINLHNKAEIKNFLNIFFIRNRLSGRTTEVDGQVSCVVHVRFYRGTTGEIKGMAGSS